MSQKHKLLGIPTGTPQMTFEKWANWGNLIQFVSNFESGMYILRYLTVISSIGASVYKWFSWWKLRKKRYNYLALLPLKSQISLFKCYQWLAGRIINISVAQRYNLNLIMSHKKLLELRLGSSKLICIPTYWTVYTKGSASGAVGDEGLCLQDAV